MKNIKTEKFKNLVLFIIFIAIIIIVYTKLTYLMRNSSMDRANVTGIKEENGLDVVCIGGSSTLVYWQPLKAWHEYGFTSYNYSTNTNQAESIKYYIKDILKTNRPELFVVDLRAFQYWTPELDEIGLRNGLDSMDLNMDRFEYARYALKNREISEDTDVLSFYFDIAKYHTQYEALANPANWEYLDNSTYRPDKGFEWGPYAVPQDEPKEFKTSEKGILDERCLWVLEDLLEYCREEKLQVLFVVCPYVITKEDMMKYNTMAELIQEYGYLYLNTNEYYEEMGIDFVTDFYNAEHVDCLGAEKYTYFMGGYICNNFNIFDHSNEHSNYEVWNREYERFEKDDESRKKRCYQAIEKTAEGYRVGNSLKDIKDFYEWLAMTHNDKFTIFIVTQGDLDEAAISAGRKYFFSMADASVVGERYLGIELNGGGWTVCGEDAEFYQPAAGKEYCELRSGEKASVIIDGVEHCLGQPGINLVVYNNDYKCVMDSVALSVDTEGNIKILR